MDRQSNWLKMIKRNLTMTCSMWPAECTQVRIFYPAEREAAVKCPRGKWLPESYGRTQGYAEAYANAMFRPGVNATLVGTALILEKYSTQRRHIGNISGR